MEIFESIIEIVIWVFVYVSEVVYFGCCFIGKIYKLYKKVPTFITVVVICAAWFGVTLFLTAGFEKTFSFLPGEAEEGYSLVLSCFVAGALMMELAHRRMN